MTTKQNTKKAKPLSLNKVIIKMLPVMFKTSPVLMSIGIAGHILSALLLTAETVFLERLYSQATELFDGHIIFTAALSALVAFALIGFLNQVCGTLTRIALEFSYEKVIGVLTSQFHQKVGRIPCQAFEDTTNLDYLNKADNGKNCTYWFVQNYMMMFFYYIPYFIFMSWYLIMLKPLLALAIIIIFVPTFFAQIVRLKSNIELENLNAPLRRQTEAHERAITHKNYFKETRILGAYSYFRKKYYDCYTDIQKRDYRVKQKINAIDLSMRIITLIGYVGIIYMLFSALMNRDIPVGAFGAILAALGTMFGMMESMVHWRMSWMLDNMGYVRNYLGLMDMKEMSGSNEAPPEGNIDLQNITYRYPESETDAVKNLNLTIKKGETVALVGENGSGKTTLVRLLSGLYTPTEGKVCYGGVPIDTVHPNVITKNVSSVFQNYNRYLMSVKENISISDTKKEFSISQADEIAKNAGVEVDNKLTYPDGFDTMLAREFGGVELSGGQWQRVAIARAYYKDCDLIILDEPTAAIDPIEETRVYNEFARITRDRTAVIVTHRLGSVKLADRIAVMKDGELAELGTHDELIKKGGEYASMYKAQEQWYKEQ